LASGTKDFDGAGVILEPLARYNSSDELVPYLAEEIPTIANGGVAADGTSVTWKLKKGVKWSDGSDFTADDVIFTWQYASNPETAATTSSNFNIIKSIDAVDANTVTITWNEPNPDPYASFVSYSGMVIQKKQFEACVGAAALTDAACQAANLAPIGTNAWKLKEFKPGDVVVYERNENYRDAANVYFDTVEIKGGGDAASAARAVLQTADFDYAWNLQVEDAILQRLEAAGRGRVNIIEGGNIEFVQLNAADPNREVEGERAHPNSRHPAFQDPAVRQAMALLIDRQALQQHIYGRGGPATANFLNNPPRFRSPNMRMEFSVERANQILDQAGWVRGSDGIRAKDGVRLRFVYQTSVNAPRQRTQAVYKQAAQRAGIDLELKSVVASVFFSSDVANPDTYTKFWSDMQMYTTTMPQADPQLFMNQFVSWEVSTRANSWQGRNIVRWRSEEYDRIYREAEGELDHVKRAALFIRMNDLVVGSNHIIPVVRRPRVRASLNNLRPVLSAWDNDFWLLSHWHREG